MLISMTQTSMVIEKLHLTVVQYLHNDIPSNINHFPWTPL